MHRRVDKIITGMEMRTMLIERFMKDERCKKIERIGIYRLAGIGLPNWEVAFVGGSPGSEANRAVEAIAAQVAAEYDVAW